MPRQDDYLGSIDNWPLPEDYYNTRTHAEKFLTVNRDEEVQITEFRLAISEEVVGPHGAGDCHPICIPDEGKNAARYYLYAYWKPGDIGPILDNFEQTPETNNLLRPWMYVGGIEVDARGDCWFDWERLERSDNHLHRLNVVIYVEDPPAFSGAQELDAEKGADCIILGKYALDSCGVIFKFGDGGREE